MGSGRIEPLERRLVAAPGHDGQQHRREVDPGDVRLAKRAQLVALGPQADCEARAESCGPPRPLVGGIGGDPFGLQRVERARGVVSRDLLPAGVDDGDARRGR